jgi:tetratricopeptide (TPR) repeat protein
MKYLFQFFLYCLFTISISAQPLLTDINRPAGNGNTYAVIIGISSYLDTDINALQFSNRDAQVFADFLMSASGGSVPKQNIKLLIDAAATTGEVDKAILWLKNNCQAGDKVFFYFSGHGALENETVFRDGYLICYNTPAAAFIRMGLSIDWLNKMATTISDKKANVVIITDACHSGRVAKNTFKGNMLVGEQLMNASEKEIRMASCTPDQLSIEKADWGGGRGVFSYHLINGLQGGLADKDLNGIVTTGEIKNYMEYRMANDSVLKRDNEIQTPVVKGRADFQLATVIQADAIQIKKMVREDSIANVMLSASIAKEDDETNAEPEYYFNDLLKKENLETLSELLGLSNIAVDKIAFTIINRLKAGNIAAAGISKLNELETILTTDPVKLNEFNINLSRAFNDKGQEMIVQYLKGDEAEIERRRYYNSKSNGYDVYVRMLEVALKLSQGDNYLSTKSAVLLHYFTGVSLRLKIPLAPNPQPLIEQAFAELNKALALEVHAAYIYNELGILYEYKKNFGEAEKNYLKAIEFSDRWALPYSNLCGLYAARGLFEKSTAACNKADSLKPNFLAVKINRGYQNETKGNNLLAEAMYYDAIEINNRHFAAFERLGFVNMNNTNYAKADSFFYEAAQRKMNFNFAANTWDVWDLRASMGAPEPDMICDFDSINVNPADILANFARAVQEYRRYDGDKAMAKELLLKVIQLDKTNPLVYHYLGKIYFDEQRWEEAELMFKLAMQYYRDEPGILNYTDSLGKSVSYGYDQTCFKDFFKSCAYKSETNYYLTGTLYESWKHNREAERCFKNGITLNPNEIGGYAKLWNLYEKQGRYIETEEVINKVANFNKDQSDRELNAFYHRVIEKFPDEASWNYKLGLLLYSRASKDSKIRYLDSIVWFPLMEEELFIDQQYFEELARDTRYALPDESVKGVYDKYRLDFTPFSLKYPAFYDIPETNERMDAADQILMPRKDGITYLTKAAELIADKATLADINFKIGNIYQWAGSKKQAYPYFEKSLSFNPDDANVRMALIDNYTALYKNNDALAQLNYLNDSNQINVERRLQLAQFSIQAGQFEKATVLLNQAALISPYKSFEIETLKGRLTFLSKKSADAIKFYKAYLLTNTADSMASYTLARIYAKAGNSKEAFRYLETAVKNGFNYSYVLKYDPYLDKLRKSEKWQIIFSNVKPLEYKSKKPIN